MESPPVFSRVGESALRKSDYLLLFSLCALLFGFSLVQPRVFTTHETTHCLNVREMVQSGEYLIPTYGGRPWLERPPAPHWLTAIFTIITGQTNSDWAMRLGSIIMATLAVLVMAWAVAACFGRIIGLMSGAILATMREFAAYAVGPEADIFLASTVTICGALFLRLEFAGSTLSRSDEGRKSDLPPSLRDSVDTSFFGKRPVIMLLFFFLLGLTNWMKGPLFGMIFVLLPMGGYFLWSRDFGIIRRFAWIWGWVLLIAVGAAWPMVAYLYYPDVVELWAVDYGVRWQSGYIGEPIWYYLVHQPWNIFPWTIPALAGVLVTTRSVLRSPRRKQENPMLVPRALDQSLRFIWCWAILPVVFFSLFKGKHHHYMLSCLAPAAVLGAFGSIGLWHWIRTWPGKLRHPGVSLVAVGIPGSLMAFWFGKKVPGPEWIQWSLVLGWPAVAFAMGWAVTRRDGRIAFAGTCSIIVVLNCLAYAHRAQFLDSYVADRAFVEQVMIGTGDGKPLFVINDEHPLNSSWLVYYVGERSRLLHNHTFLRDDRIEGESAYVVCRMRDEARLVEYGKLQRLAQSAKARGETSPGDRWTLYELRFHPHLARVPGDVRISPLQATGRKPGPFLGVNSESAAQARGR